MHANAAPSLKGRRRMVAAVLEQGRSITEAAVAAGVSERTCSKWVSRYRAEGPAGLADRCSAPRRVANRTDEQTVEAIAALWRLRHWSRAGRAVGDAALGGAQTDRDGQARSLGP